MHLQKIILLSVSSLALVFACQKEPAITSEPEASAVLPFSITVDSAPGTRASFDGDSFGNGSYVFSAGDKIYLSGGEGHITGVLDISTGANTGTATFDGSISITGGYTPTAETDLTATLVGASQTTGANPFFTIVDGQISGAPSYPATIPYTTLADLVQKYSHLTSTFKYNLRRFTLTQQTVFLCYTINLLKDSLTGSPSSLQVDIKSSDGLSTLRSVTGIPVTGSAVIAALAFSTPFPASAALQGAQTWVVNGSGVQCSPDFSGDLVLTPNNYYSVYRTNVEDFTVEAPSSGTGATVTFNYPSNVEYNKYSGGAWTGWTSYSEPIYLSAGSKVCFRGRNSSYTNTDGNTPLISTDNSVNIYGDIMSLLCDSNGNRQFSVGANAFKEAFKGCTNINIPADNELLLSAETLVESCYEGMFSGCTSLTKTPILPATTMAAACYKRMFEGCSGLSNVPSGLLPAMVLAASCYDSMFITCTSLANTPALPATTMAAACYRKMFEGCSGLSNVPLNLLPAGTLAQSCYDCMFMTCTSLTNTPTLPATTMALACYRKMFEGCSSLYNVPSNLLPAMTLAKGCYARMFWQCTSLVTAPDLPATVASPGCYFGMFRHCSKLNSLKCYLPLSGLDSSSTSEPSGINKAQYEDTDPTPEHLNNWSSSTLWTVVNKWLNNTCTSNGGKKGSFQCPSDMNSVYKTGDNEVGAVPTSKWTKSNL